MAKKKEEVTREVPKTNYYILAALIVLVISLCTATYNIYNIYEDYKWGQVSPLNLDKAIDYSELSSMVNEMQEDTFLVISYTGDEDILQNEKNLKIVFRKYELLDNIIYLDVTKEMENDGCIEGINTSLGLTDSLQVETIPSIIYFKEGKVQAVAKSKNGIVDTENLESIVKKYINVD